MRSHEFVIEANRFAQQLAAGPWPGAPTPAAWIPNSPLPAGWLQAWKGDARTGTIETLPHRFNPSNMTKQLSAYKWARDRKLLPVIPPEIWAMLAMVEGREDFGYNGVSTSRPPGKDEFGFDFGPNGSKGDNTSPRLEKFAVKVEQAGMTDYADAIWIAFLYDKLATAQRLGIPFYRAWNGSSTYQARFDAQAKALQNPKNEPFLNWFKQQLA